MFFNSSAANFSPKLFFINNIFASLLVTLTLSFILDDECNYESVLEGLDLMLGRILYLFAPKASFRSRQRRRQHRHAQDLRQIGR